MINFAKIRGRIRKLPIFTYPIFCRMNHNRLRNRLVIAAIMLGAAIGTSALELPTRTVNGNVCYYYEVQPKETVYNLARRFGLTKAQIIQYNPSVADGLRAGQTLYFPKDEVDRLPHPATNSAAAATKPTPTATVRPTSHLVKKGETIYGISRQYDIAEADLIAANPRLETTGLKYGSVLTIPGKGTTADAADSPSSADTEVYRTPTIEMTETRPSTDTPVNHTETAEVSGVYVTPDSTLSAMQPQVEDSTILYPLETVMPKAEEKNDTLRMTVMLPFMLSSQKPDKQAQLYTEFYRGILLAADSLRSHGKPMVISAYDTAASIDTVNSILSNGDVARSSVIIAPDDELQLGRIAAFASEKGCKVFNIFAVKSILYNTNPAMMQANIPHSDMYDTAVKGLLSEYQDYVPVMLVPGEGGKTDKTEFQHRLRDKAVTEGREVIEITYNGVLKQADLERLKGDTRYIFIPSSGTQTEFSRIIGALKNYKENLEDYNGARLFGYPEWITFRGDALDNMRFMNTTIYSRFYNDESSLRTKDLIADYSRWYGAPMMNAIPVQGILGFDAGMYLIRALNDADGFPSDMRYSGIQSDFLFDTEGDGHGYVNKALYLVNFRPSGITERISL